jgi:putative NADH-flavin reductase
MKLAIIGATGRVGQVVLNEALERGHTVTAVARNTDKLPKHAHLTAKAADIHKPGELAAVLAGHDAIIASFNPALPEGREGFKRLIEAARQSGVKRFVAVGGAGSLLTSDGRRYLDTDEFNPAWRGGAAATADFLEALRGEKELDWVMLSPAAVLEPGPRTGKFRLGGDTILKDAKGESRISLADFAMALLDEVEKPKHHRARFTLAY